MFIGARIFYDQDGEIVLFHGDMQGDVLPRKEITKLEHIDMEHGEVDLTKYQIVRINTDTKKPVLKKLLVEPTQTERIKELEDQVLLMANENTGGIL